MKKFKWVDRVIMVLFCSFAFVQLNDQDAFIWIIIYLSVVLLSFLASLNYRLFNKDLSLFTKLHFGGIVLLAIYYGFYYLFNLGQNEGSFMDPGQETLREILGIVITLGVSLYYLKREIKKR